MNALSLDVPDVPIALGAIDRWSAGDPDLAALLAGGASKANAVARWGLSLLKAGRSLDAVTALRVGVALSPEDPTSWTNLGIAFDRAGSPELATNCFERSVTLSQNQPHTWLLLGLARKKSGDLGGADIAYRAALDQDATSAVVWQCMGLLQEERKDYQGAIECFTACGKYSEPSAAIFANLGKLNYQIGNVVEAREAFVHATALDPGNGHYRQMLGKARFLVSVVSGGSVDEAVRVFDEDLQREGPDGRPSLLQWLETSSGLLGSFGHVDAATRLARKRLELQPDSAAAKYLLAALCGESRVEKSPAAYIVENFDAFAEGFDAKLVGVLGYDVPEKLCALVEDATRPGHRYEALDAGCGTGLCGPLLRPLAQSLTGVDLSAKMLDLAAKRGVYDALHCEDITEFLAHSGGQYDLIVASDVLIYFGELSSLFALVGQALRPSGLFAFSAERFTGEGYHLQPSGRFAHSRTYIRGAGGLAFSELAVLDTTLRLEAKERVPGYLVVLRRS